MDEHEILPYIEPIFRFCCKRLSNRFDAEDLSHDILFHVLDGMKKYRIESLNAWVWRIAHNRYAQFVKKQSGNPFVLMENELLTCLADTDDADHEEEDTTQKFEAVFHALHTLSAEYRNIFVDYYVGELSVKALSEKYSLPETTIKWRLNAGRQKIRDRIGEDQMDKIYTRINWNTTTCNGSMNPDQYLHTQISRAICEATYEKPLTVEEISLATGIPTIYIEDELPRLEYGDAIRKIGNKYAADFIIFRLQDQKNVESASTALIDKIADKMEALLTQAPSDQEKFDFYGQDFGMERLGYIVIPYLLRRKIWASKKRLKLENGPYPPRKDGGYGWFQVTETPDENENLPEYSTGCNVAGDDDGSKNDIISHIYYYWLAKYFDVAVYHNGGLRWMCAKGIPQNSKNGMIAAGALSDEDAARLIQKNLITKAADGYSLNFPCFTHEQFEKWISRFDIADESLDDRLAEWIGAVRKSFENFVPSRLEDQINQFVSAYLGQIIGKVTETLIADGTLKKPDTDRPLVYGVFYVEGEYINP